MDRLSPGVEPSIQWIHPSLLGKENSTKWSWLQCSGETGRGAVERDFELEVLGPGATLPLPSHVPWGSRGTPSLLPLPERRSRLALSYPSVWATRFVKMLHKLSRAMQMPMHIIRMIEMPLPGMVRSVFHRIHWWDSPKNNSPLRHRSPSGYCLDSSLISY